MPALFGGENTPEFHQMWARILHRVSQMNLDLSLCCLTIGLSCINGAVASDPRCPICRQGVERNDIRRIFLGAT